MCRSVHIDSFYESGYSFYMSNQIKIIKQVQTIDNDQLQIQVTLDNAMYALKQGKISMDQYLAICAETEVKAA